MDTNYFSLKKMFWAYTICSIPFALLTGILSLLNVIPVYFNEAPNYGFKGFILSIIFIPFIGLLFSVTNWLALNLGVLLYRAFYNKFKQNN
jgi:hypothetical protein